MKWSSQTACVGLQAVFDGEGRQSIDIGCCSIIRAGRSAGLAAAVTLNVSVREPGNVLVQPVVGVWDLSSRRSGMS